MLHVNVELKYITYINLFIYITYIKLLYITLIFTLILRLYKRLYFYRSKNTRMAFGG